MVFDEGKVYTSNPPQYGYKCPMCGNYQYSTEPEYDKIQFDIKSITYRTPNNKKCLLVTYVDVSDVSADVRKQRMCQVQIKVEQAFHYDGTDDTMVFITLPSDHTDIKVFNMSNLDIAEEDIKHINEFLKK